MSVIEIDEPSDARLTDYRDLTDVALRSAAEPVRGLYMAEGSKVIGRALAAGHEPRSLLVEDKRLHEALALVGDRREVPIFTAGAGVMRSITGYRVHRGFLSAMHRPAPRTVADVTSGATRVLVLEDLVDHTNVGAAFRSAAALGFHAVVVSPRCADPLYRRSIKVSMAAVLTMPWAAATPWPDALHDLRAVGFTLLALTPSEDAVELATVAADPPRRLALLIGTEGDGLTGPALDACHSRVRIPMAGGIDSLNAAAASAVACYALRPAPRSSSSMINTAKTDIDQG